MQRIETAKRHVLLAELEFGGHHFSLYIDELLREMIDRGWIVSLLTTEEAVKAPDVSGTIAKYHDRIKVYLTRNPRAFHPGGVISLLRYQLDYYFALRRGVADAMKHESFDAAYIVNLDPIDKVLPLLGSPFLGIRFAGTLMHTRFHHWEVGIRGASKDRARVRKMLFQRTLAIGDLLFINTADETLYDYAKSRGCNNKLIVVAEAQNKPMGYLPHGLVRNNTRNPGEVLVVAYGALSMRKGIRTLVDALAHPMCPEHVSALLAGSQSKEVKELLSREPARSLLRVGRLKMIDRYILPDEEPEIIGAGSVVWLGYQGFLGMSGVLHQAAGFGRPVIACQEGLIGRTVEKYGLGWVLSPTDSEQAARLLSRIRIDSEEYESAKHALGVYFEISSLRRFAPAICEAIDERAGTEKASVQMPGRPSDGKEEAVALGGDK